MKICFRDWLALETNESSTYISVKIKRMPKTARTDWGAYRITYHNYDQRRIEPYRCKIVLVLTL